MISIIAIIWLLVGMVSADHISSCGPAKNWAIAKDFNRVVEEFCRDFDGTTLLSGNGVKKTLHGITMTNDAPGHVDFEIKNLSRFPHPINYSACEYKFKRLSEPGTICYGWENKDTRGGTWVVGNNEVTYFAVPYYN
ncbi:hypothetical protein B0J11DRAFT_595741 [Dendryphion nanum]|uniref:Uncharacterized protein n=1 Tax=Dendryphion nanum TaxID=256645 RepID=A0A9P9ED36_9PLEO|nr:hypothetical protein B0J11DRAFT_595741 [Dendryphion nanum]